MKSNNKIKNKTKRFRSKIKGGMPVRERDFLDAIKQGNLDKVNTLLNEYEYIVKSVDNGGWTLLHHVCILKRKIKVDKQIAFALIDKRADVNARTQEGYTPIGITCRMGKTELAVALIEKGANINIRTNKGNTPLHIACLYGHDEIAMALIDKGADIESMNYINCTPLNLAVLHFGSENNNIDVIMGLINKGADPLKNNDSNYSAIDYMVDNKFLKDLPEMQPIIINGLRNIYKPKKGTCNICMEENTTLIELPCNHSFCPDCITELCKKQEFQYSYEPDDPAYEHTVTINARKCPECRKEFKTTFCTIALKLQNGEISQSGGKKLHKKHKTKIRKNTKRKTRKTIRS